MKKGTTLIEIILYFAIVGIILTAAMSFAIQVLTITKESDNFHELQSGINIISDKIFYTIQTAESINVAGSIFDNDIGKLSLNMEEAFWSPTNFYLENNVVYIKEGAGAAIALNSNLIKCTKLRFQKISYSKTPDQVVIDAEFSPINADIQNLEQTLKFHTSVSLRKL